MLDQIFVYDLTSPNPSVIQISNNNNNSNQISSLQSNGNKIVWTGNDNRGYGYEVDSDIYLYDK